MTCLTGTAQQDTICRPVDEVKKLLIDSRKLPICDSLLQNRIKTIEALEDKIKIQESQKSNLIEATEVQNNKIKSLRNDVEKAEKKLKIFKPVSIVAVIVAIVETLILIVTL